MSTGSHIKALAAGVCAVAMVAQAGVAGAQPAPPYQDQNGYQQGGYPQGAPPPPPPPGQGDVAPPPGQPVPPPSDARSGGAYDPRAQQYDQDYARRYSAWAAQYCVDRRNNNAAAGAIIGGILGAALGGGLAGRHDVGAGVVVGGALGAGTGAAIGASSSNSANCPPGYVVRADAPAFYYGPAVYGPDVIYGPAWYNPWVFVGGQWIYRPYRSWYWGHGAYWHGGPGYRYHRHY
jgi:hypothetical protein